MPDAARPLPLRLRPDLTTTRESFGGRAYVVVKDALALRYHRLQEEEFALLELLDGRRTLEAVRDALAARFAPQQFQAGEMSRFIAAMHQAGLLISDAAGQAEPLLSRRRKARRRELLQKCLSPLAVRLPGIDPTRLFDGVYPAVRWMFTRTAMCIAVLLILAAAMLVAVQYDEVARRLPTYEQFFTPSNMLMLMAVLAGIKVVHEFGHGLTCRHFGGECHELGVMFLVFAPCLYCNVSDAWRLPKRQRIAVGAAGIVVELVLAALAVFGWWFSAPGLFHQLCLAVMVVSGVSTILVNGNPLLRYDGYFILSDLIETPNLAEKSAAVVRHAASRICLGYDLPADPMLPEQRRGWFALYAAASMVYRLVLTFSIMMFLMAWLRPYRLEVFARTFGLISLSSIVAPPLYRFARFAVSANRAKFKVNRTLVTASAAIAVLAAITFVPLPQRVWAALEIEPRDVTHVYVDVAGMVPTEVVEPGTVVAAGTVLARLDNVDLRLEEARLTGRVGELQSQLASLRRERFHDPGAALRVPEVEQSLAATAELLAEKRAELDRLVLRASRDGVVFPPPETPAPRESALGELPHWSGLPTSQINRGAALAEGTLFCQVGDADAWQALAAVDQTDVGLLAVGQSVAIRIEELPEIHLTGRIEEISRRELVESPRRLSNKAGGDLATVTDEAGVERPQSATYQVRIALDNSCDLLRIGLRGTARIHVQPEAIGPRVVRWMSRTFHFDL